MVTFLIRCLWVTAFMMRAAIGQDANLERHLDPSYEEDLPFPVLTSPTELSDEQCHRFRCPESTAMDVSLEEEFWSYTQNNDTHRLIEWQARTTRYCNLSQTAGEARLRKLISFARLQLSRSHPLASPKGLRYLISGIRAGIRAERLSPDEFGIHAFNLVVKYMLPSTSRKMKSEDIIQELLRMREVYGAWGLEGTAIAAHNLVQSRDRSTVRRGIELFTRNNEEAITLASSIAPFKPLGEYYTIGEAYVYLEEYENAATYFGKAIEFGETHHYPDVAMQRLRQTIDRVYTEYAARWQDGRSLGNVRLPMSPSLGAEGCTMCHVGAVTPAHHYEALRGEARTYTRTIQP